MKPEIENEVSTALSAEDRRHYSAIAARLEEKARDLWKRASQMRAVNAIQVTVSVDGIEQPESAMLVVHVGGEMHSVRHANDAEAACQQLYYLIQGFRPPLPHRPFGTRLDGTESGLCTVPDSLARNQ